MTVRSFLTAITILISGVLPWIGDAKAEPSKSSSKDAADDAENRIATVDGGAEAAASYKRLLFVDQTLEELFRGGSKDIFLAQSYDYVRSGNAKAAIASLKGVMGNPVVEIRHKLWASRGLRQLGEGIPQIGRDEVRGVVIEIPLSGWLDTLAVYSDGRVRYMNGKLGLKGLVVQEDTENMRTKPLVMSVISSAKSIVGKSPVVDTHKESAPVIEPRITVLTYGGLYILDRNAFTGNLTDPVLSSATQLYVTLMDLARTSRKR